mmetsp:Transcript_58027/g.138486  ORF Transcript_58027/g.138486 Transcript_58027/m.138486 type:complete len:201 (+) Transcript_58027:243-845(+)
MRRPPGAGRVVRAQDSSHLRAIHAPLGRRKKTRKKANPVWRQAHPTAGAVSTLQRQPTLHPEPTPGGGARGGDRVGGRLRGGQKAYGFSRRVDYRAHLAGGREDDGDGCEVVIHGRQAVLDAPRHGGRAPTVARGGWPPARARHRVTTSRTVGVLLLTPNISGHWNWLCRKAMLPFCISSLPSPRDPSSHLHFLFYVRRP